jgi:hypothetical protein
MIDRQQLEPILARRFPGAPLDQIAAAANAIMGLDSKARPGRHRRSGGRASGSGGREQSEAVAPPLPSTIG